MGEWRVWGRGTHRCGVAMRGRRSVDALVVGRATTLKHRNAFMICVGTAIASSSPVVASWLRRGSDM